MIEDVVVALIVLAAVAYLVLEWTGIGPRLRSRQRPDVSTDRLVRKRRDAPPTDSCPKC